MATVSGWAIFAHPLFLGQFERLLTAVERERQRKPKGYQRGANAKLLAQVLKLTSTVIPSDPASTAFRQGVTLGPEYRHWRRAKFGGGRFRLFFRYAGDPKVIIYAWINDENSLRTYGSRTDAYRVFRGMLDGGNPPDDWASLREACKAGALETLAERATAALSASPAPSQRR